MNKKYIKRQVTLYKLGIPISEDIIEYYNKFKDAFVNVEKVKDNNLKTVWYQNVHIFMAYYKNTSRIWVNKNGGIWICIFHY